MRKKLRDLCWIEVCYRFRKFEEVKKVKGNQPQFSNNNLKSKYKWAYKNLFRHTLLCSYGELTSAQWAGGTCLEPGGEAGRMKYMSAGGHTSQLVGKAPI
jgi:hypothetical protein